MSNLFLPIVDNGQGDIKANFFMCTLRSFKGIDLHIERFTDSLAPRARNRAAAYFLRETQRNYLLFIDADILFEQDQINLLMESDEKILAGLYCKKEKGISPCLNTLPGMQDTKCGGYIEVARAGTGFLRIHREVLEALKEKPGTKADAPDIWPYARKYTNHGPKEWDWFSVGVRNREYLSEDWYFCDRARALGYKVILDSRIQLRHEGSAIFPLEETIKKHKDDTGGRTQAEEAA